MNNLFIRIRGLIPDTFLRFCIVGAIAFCIDAGGLELVRYLFDLSPVTARIFSYVCAMSAAWWMNRKFSFKLKFNGFKNLLFEWLKYFGINSIVTLINWSVYITCIKTSQFLFTYPVFAVGIATSVAMIINYFCIKNIVFRLNSEISKK
jgi:putative flippase GtrA